MVREKELYICNNCGHEQDSYFGLCPVCKNGMGVKQEISFDNSKLSKSGMFNPREESKFQGKVNFKSVDKSAPMIKAEIKTKFKSFDEVLSSANGFVGSQVVLIGAAPGTGKSTILSQISDEDYLYISSEENYDQINNRMLRVNPESKASLLSTTSIDEVLAAIDQTDKKVVVIDSINSIEFGVGYQTTARYANDITKLVKDRNKIAVIVSQVSKGGEISGMNSLIHVVDTVLHMERSEVSSNIILTSSKNRFGEVGQVAVFNHTPKGLVETEVENDPSVAEIGTTYTETRFGHKRLTIAIDSLVTEANGGYGMRKANGYDQNRLIQIVGILSANQKKNYTDKDIYVSLSNGLRTDDISVELAIANSILSSLTKQAIVTKAYGELRLNGKVINGTATLQNGKEIKINSISELISLYGEKARRNPNV